MWRRHASNCAQRIVHVVKDLTEGEDSTTYHSRSLYIIVKKTWRNRFTAFISTASKYSHASPDILGVHYASASSVSCIDRT